MSVSEDEQKPLSKLFYEAFKIHGDVENAEEPTNSEKSQKLIKQALKLLDIVMSRADELRLFSSNEQISEVSSANLKYFISQAISGSLTLLVQTPREERKALLLSAETLFMQFLERCKDYSVGPEKEVEAALQTRENVKSKPNPRDLAAMKAQREAKIAKFKRNKELQERLEHLKGVIGETDEDVENADDEVVRNYWFAVIEMWVDSAMESIENITQEKEILSFWEKLPDKDNPPRPQAASTSQSNGKRKNFILTRDKVQANVFGAGYPSLPTMTVEEFFESSVAAGTLPDRGIQQNENGNNADEHSDSDDDNDEKLKKQRAFDDWKDTHRRGDGNRKNMG